MFGRGEERAERNPEQAEMPPQAGTSPPLPSESQTLRLGSRIGSIVLRISQGLFSNRNRICHLKPAAATREAILT